MACMVCSPFCGRCRPPQPRPVTCERCGIEVLLARDKKWICPECSAELPPREMITCNWSGSRCDIPCIRGTQKNATGAMHKCPWAKIKLKMAMRSKA